ncbi:endoplasmic reticulum junction formation protein lunapark isoform X2 [Achroia grisella]|uniref:endoplasmic reticulum junction formation protein lunapark isoform X2 n=1 Tax=Achroia grisella TaxID=688607 RepID=UPI0027D2050A|nr:endoplasmic reticulum junction formation protein lunapark isoform X2 [Achroia grisella]
MGFFGFLSRFRRKKTTSEVLERLETQIKSIEEDDMSYVQRQRRLNNYVNTYSVGLYVIFLILYYYVYMGRGQHWVHSVMYASPFVVFPIVAISLRSSIRWYYKRSIIKNRIKLNKMKEEKKQILEEVMNTETYKVAKNLLDKYGSPEEQSKALKPFVPTLNVPATPGQLRQRQLALQSSTPVSNNMNVVALNNTPAIYKGPRLRSDQLPRPLLDKNRSALDKVVDYLLKEGPNHRMALICSECKSHNGMAMVEEFEFVSYVCAYCGKMNPARKQRPAAPLLSSPRALPMATADDDSPVPSSGSDSEDEKHNGVLKIGGSDGDSDRPTSTAEEEPKSDTEKKED